jgi:CRP/FNR family transcriptional regulator, anaerobic regulatory protein
MAADAQSSSTLDEAAIVGVRALAHSAAPPIVAEKGAVLLDHHRSGGLLVLRSGWAIRVHHLPNGKRAILDVYLPGELLGSDAVLGKTPIGSIIALGQVSYERIEAGKVARLMEDASVALSLWSACVDEQARVDLLAAMLARGDAQERISAFLLNLDGRLARKKLAVSGTFRLPMTQAEIGDHLGLTVVHVNRVLRQLRQAGLVFLHRGKVSIDSEGLRSIAQGFLLPDGMEARPARVDAPGVFSTSAHGVL